MGGKPQQWRRHWTNQLNFTKGAQQSLATYRKNHNWIIPLTIVRWKLYRWFHRGEKFKSNCLKHETFSDFIPSNEAVCSLSTAHSHNTPLALPLSLLHKNTETWKILSIVRCHGCRALHVTHSRVLWYGNTALRLIVFGWPKASRFVWVFLHSRLGRSSVSFVRFARFDKRDRFQGNHQTVIIAPLAALMLGKAVTRSPNIEFTIFEMKYSFKTNCGGPPLVRRVNNMFDYLTIIFEGVVLFSENWLFIQHNEMP